MEIMIDDAGQLVGRWCCKAALMNQREPSALSTRFSRILQAAPIDSRGSFLGRYRRNACDFGRDGQSSAQLFG